MRPYSLVGRVILHLQMKPPVEFVRKTLDNALEITYSLRLSIDINLASLTLHLYS